MIKAVLFDLDETLFDRTRTLHAFLTDQFERFCARLGQTELETWRQRFLELDNKGLTPKAAVYPQILSDFGGEPGAAAQLLEDYYHRSTAGAFAMPGMSKILSDLKRCGFLCGLITNGETKLQSRTISALGLEDRMDAILISQAEGVRKPDPAIFHRAAQQLGAAPGTCVYVGDNPEADILGAVNAGLRGIWFNPTGRRWPAKLGPQKGQTIAALTEILGLLSIN